MNYSFFVFTRIYHVMIGAEFQYKKMFDFLIELFAEYEASLFNNKNFDEPDRMVAFFQANRSRIKNESLKNL